MDEVETLLGRMEPRQAAEVVARAAREIFPLLDDGERREFITAMLGEPGGDQVVGLVHL